MDDATYVVFAPTAKRIRFREQLRAVVDESLHWRERRRFSGSEFFISGPPARAREAHEAAMRWLAKAEAWPG
jgi:hypothetical protein